MEQSKSLCKEVSERHLPRTWEKIYGIRIIDPDGWRQDNKSFNAPLSRSEWLDRMAISTVEGLAAKVSIIQKN